MKLQIIVISIIVSLLCSCSDEKKPVYEVTMGDIPIMSDSIPLFDPKFAPKEGLFFVGTYKGSFPCSDCKSTDVTIILNNDNTFSREVITVGNPDGGFSHSGVIMWNETGNKIELEGKSKSKYEVRDGNLYPLGLDGAQCMTHKGKELVLYSVK